jgi:hypothetical protein
MSAMFILKSDTKFLPTTIYGTSEKIYCQCCSSIVNETGAIKKYDYEDKELTLQ